MKLKGPYTIKKNNKLKAYGQTDLNKKVIEINKKKNKGHAKGEYLDTTVHEMLHAAHPKMSEKQVQKKTKEVIDKMSKLQKQRLYKLI